MSNLKEILETLKNFTPQQIVVIITIISSCFTGFFWIESRYANLVKTEQNIERMLNNIIQIDSKLTATINQFPEEKIKKIDEIAKKQEEIIKSYANRIGR